MSNSNITISNRKLAAIEKSVQHRFPELAARFVNSPTDAAKVPGRLLGGLSRSAFVKLPPVDRTAHLEAAFRAQLVAEAETHARYAAEHGNPRPRAQKGPSTTKATLRGGGSAPALAPPAEISSTSSSTTVVELLASTPTRPPRYVVSCAGGCGAMLAAPSTRPVLRFCDGPRPPRRPRQRTPEQIAAGKKARRDRGKATCGGLTLTTS